MFFVNNHQAQVLVFHVFIHHAVRANQNIHAAIFHVFQDFFDLFFALKTADVGYPRGKIGQPLAECFVVLHGQNGSWHQHGHLLAVAHGLESRPYGHLGFAKTHVAAHEAVHGVGVFHVGFYVGGGFGLVGCVLVLKRRFEFGLQVVVAAKTKTRGVAAFGVECNEFVGNVFDLLFYPRLFVVPIARPEFTHHDTLAFFARVLGYFVQTMNADQQNIVVAVDEPDGLLLAPAHVHLFESRKTPNAVIHVRNKIARLQGFQLFERQGFAFTKFLTDLVFVKPRKNLVVGVAHYFKIWVHKSLAQGDIHGPKFQIRVEFFQNPFQPFELFGRIGGDNIEVALLLPLRQIVNQSFKIFIERRL